MKNGFLLIWIIALIFFYNAAGTLPMTNLTTVETAKMQYLQNGLEKSEKTTANWFGMLHKKITFRIRYHSELSHQNLINFLIEIWSTTTQSATNVCIKYGIFERLFLYSESASRFEIFRITRGINFLFKSHVVTI